MSDKITKTVENVVEKYGNCWNCESLFELKQYKNSHVCLAFGKEIINCQQCQGCKDYLAEQKSRVYCDGCGHFWAKRSFGELEPRCALGHEQKGEMYNYYSNNCQDRGE